MSLWRLEAERLRKVLAVGVGWPVSDLSSVYVRERKNKIPSRGAGRKEVFLGDS